MGWDVCKIFMNFWFLGIFLCFFWWFQHCILFRNNSNILFLDFQTKYQNVLDSWDLQTQMRLREGSQKNYYESLDICPNWVYPTYLKPSMDKNKFWQVLYFLPYLPIQKVWTFLNGSLFLNAYFLTFVRILLDNNHARYHQGHL